jgi:release factor glutamine methyltransferase
LQKESQNSYYVPAEDSIFLADYLENQKGRSALDIGTGSGILAKVLSKNFDLVVATDIDRKSVV